MRDVLSVWYCILVVGGIVAAMVYCDGLTMVSWRAVVLFRACVVMLSAVVVDAAGGAVDQLLSLSKTQQ